MPTFARSVRPLTTFNMSVLVAFHCSVPLTDLGYKRECIAHNVPLQNIRMFSEANERAHADVIK